MKQSNVSIPEGHFIFRNKPNAKGERTIYLAYYVDREQVMASTSVAVKPSDWDSKKELVKTRHLTSAKLNLRLAKMKDRVDQLLESHRGPFPKEVVRKMLAGGYLTEWQKEENEKSRDFIQYALDYNQLCYNLEKLAYSTYNNDKYNIEKFRMYYAHETGESILPLCAMTVEIFDRYKAYCLKTGNKKQSINKKLKPLFKAIEYARKNDLVPSKLATSICEGYFNLKSRKYEAELDEEDVRYLTMEQLSVLNNLYHKVKHDRTREFIDMFMFSFYSCGLRFSDLLTLEWSHIDWEKKEINKNLYKGKIPHNVPLTDSAMQILEIWKQKGYNKRFVFDLLPDYFDLTNVAELDSQRKSKNRALQTSLNELGIKMDSGLSFNLSIHVARHTFAVKALNDGVSLHIISRLLGHGSITTTEKVYAKFLPSTITNEVRSRMNYRIDRDAS
jgi:integrase